MDDLTAEDRAFLACWFSVPVAAYEPAVVPEAVGRRKDEGYDIGGES